MHGFLYNAGSSPPSTCPERKTYPTASTMPARLSVGGTAEGIHGFLYDGSFTTIEVPGARATYPNGINDAGQIVGFYYDSSAGPRLRVQRRLVHHG